MIQCSLGRYTTWPGKPTEKRKGGAFRVDYLRLLEDLSSELVAIRANSVELGMDIPENKLRSSTRSFDGWPKSDATWGNPGVILRFDRNGRPMEFVCDQYLHWQDNLRGIGLTLEALRAVARYGATQRNEQYRGYERQIAAAPAPASQQEEDRRAARVIAVAAGCEVAELLVDRDAFGAAFRTASAKTVAKHGHDSVQMRTLNDAAEILKRRHGR